ncbi:glycosyltransferase [Conexibacter sp. SYSU D00693]|uniref:glycosyltransferase n=1 Tax=Conexibacter sp. SYSU D00693 TaxID=2812560 RepID=UPI00196B9442|nr:glycosyltransferase [Conexibacter sp. SYSU D00693]
MADRTEVLYLAPWVDLGGSDKGTIDWFRSLDRERFAASLVCTQDSPNRWVHMVEPFAEEVWTLPDLMAGDAFPRFVLSFIESRGVQVVHIMNSRLGFDLLPDISALPEPPAVVVQLHAEEPGHGGYARYAATRYAGLVDAFSVTSHQLARTMRSYDVPPSKLEVIYTGIDAEHDFNPEGVEPFDHVREGDVPVVLWPGRLVEQKDPHLTLDVVQELRTRGVAFVLHVVGDGWLKDEVVARATELGLMDRLRFHESSQEIARWYASSELLLMTSTFEGVPYVIYEALAMGVPVVAPALPGNVELMDDDAGRLIDPRDDVQAYADAVQELLEDAPKRRGMGERSRERMRREFNVRKMAAEHEDLYLRLVERRAARAPRAAVAPVPRPEVMRLEREPAPPRTVAVVVPCFQHGRYLEACIASIRAQTLPATQVIVVDDASPDPETHAALSRLEDAPDVEVLRLEHNSGPSTARNRALERVEASYVLPLDADDLLLPEALESMVGQLEAATSDVAFVYPNAQHFGNRQDYWEPPDFNPYLLTFENICPATSLFDMRVFAEGGVRYAEDLRVGHEDWDLVLQLIDRGLSGVRARIPTFLYRKRGFSRVDLVHLGDQPFAEQLGARHPQIFGRLDEFKAQHAPALSLMLLPGDEAWEPAAVTALAGQVVRDFEVLSAHDGPVHEAVSHHVVTRADDPAAWFAAALDLARGTTVAVLGPNCLRTLVRRDAVEYLHRVLDLAHVDAVGLLSGLPGTPPVFALADPGMAHTGRPAGVVWRRSRVAGSSRKIVLGEHDDLLAELLAGLELTGEVHLRGLGAVR